MWLVAGLIGAGTSMLLAEAGFSPASSSALTEASAAITTNLDTGQRIDSAGRVDWRFSNPLLRRYLPAMAPFE